MTTRRSRPKLKPIPLEHRAAMKALAEEVAEKVAKRVLYRSQESHKKAIHEALSELGFLSEDAGDRNEVVLDATFLRRLRVNAQSRPAKFGFAIFTTFMGVIAALVTMAAQSFWHSLAGKTPTP